MDGSPLSRVHGLQSEGAPRPRNPVRYPHSQATQNLGSTVAILFNVQHDSAVGLVRRAAQQQVHHELHAAQGLSTPADEESRVVPRDLDQLRIRRVVRWLGYGGYGGNAHCRQEVVNNHLCCLDKPSALCQQSRSDPGRFTTNAEEAGLTLTENLYFYLFAPCVELL